MSIEEINRKTNSTRKGVEAMDISSAIKAFGSHDKEGIASFVAHSSGNARQENQPLTAIPNSHTHCESKALKRTYVPVKSQDECQNAAQQYSVEQANGRQRWRGKQGKGSKKQKAVPVNDENANP